MADYVRLAAILGGGDWADASVDHVKLKQDINLDDIKKEYGAWYRNEYCSYLGTTPRPEYYTFVEWLINHEYAIKATGKDIEIFEE